MTTNTPTDTTAAGQVIAFPAETRDRSSREAVADAMAKLRPRVAAGDGDAMLAALDLARLWWDAFPAVDAAEGGNGTADYLLKAGNELERLVAEAPTVGLPALLAKARLAEIHWVLHREGWAKWEEALATSLREGVEALAARAGRESGARG